MCRKQRGERTDEVSDVLSEVVCRTVEAGDDRSEWDVSLVCFWESVKDRCAGRVRRTEVICCDRVDVMKSEEEVDERVGVCGDAFCGVVVQALVCVVVVKMFSENLFNVSGGVHDGDATALVRAFDGDVWVPY